MLLMDEHLREMDAQVFFVLLSNHFWFLTVPVYSGLLCHTLPNLFYYMIHYFSF